MNAWRTQGSGGGGGRGQAKRAWREKREGEKRKTGRKGDSAREERCIRCALPSSGETTAMGRTETVGESGRETEGKKERMHLWIAR